MGLLSGLFSSTPDDPFFVGKHERWLVESYEELGDEAKKLLWEGVFEILDTLPFRDKIVDVLLCGSYARGYAHPRSDFDIGVEFKDQVDQDEHSSLVSLVSDSTKDWKLGFVLKSLEVQKRLGVKIEFSFKGYGQKSYNSVYSYSEKRFFGKEWGEKVETRRKWDPVTKTYAPVVVAPHA